MIIVDGKEYRNLEEQVQYLSEKIEGATSGGVGIDKLTKVEDVGEPTVTYDTTDGITIETTDRYTYKAGNLTAFNDVPTTKEIPIFPGKNITIDANPNGTGVIISSNGGGGGTAGVSSIDGQVLSATNTVTTIAGVSGPIELGTGLSMNGVTLSATAQGGGEAVTLNAASTATNGTLTAEQLAKLQANDLNYIIFNNEFYYLGDKGYQEGYLGYTHNGYENSTGWQKTITITISTRAWALTVSEIGGGGGTGGGGTAAGFGTPVATINNTVGTPSVTVTASGPDTAKVFKFNFSNLKGDPGSSVPKYLHIITTSPRNGLSVMFIDQSNTQYGSFEMMDYLRNNNYTTSDTPYTFIRGQLVDSVNNQINIVTGVYANGDNLEILGITPTSPNEQQITDVGWTAYTPSTDTVIPL